MFKCVAEKVEGYSHTRRSQPCQDAYETYRDDDFVALAVADGHGNQMHKYSSDGSHIATECVIDIFKDILLGDQPRTMLEETMSDIPKKVEKEWKKRIREFHYKMVEDEGREVILDRKSNKPQIDNYFNLNILYGTTLLAAIYAEDFTFALQIGDGDIVYVDDNGECRYLIEKEEQIGSATNSMCMVDCHKYFRIRYIDHETEFKPIMLFLSTDGYANSYRNDSDFLKVVREYIPIMNDHSERKIKLALTGWLNETSKLGSGDDITAAIVYNCTNKLGLKSPTISVTPKIQPSVHSSVGEEAEKAIFQDDDKKKD